MLGEGYTQISTGAATSGSDQILPGEAPPASQGRRNQPHSRSMIWLGDTNASTGQDPCSSDAPTVLTQQPAPSSTETANTIASRAIQAAPTAFNLDAFMAAFNQTAPVAPPAPN
ncbi:hypothetical protein V7S43_003597 [Phytophthora oleae]|uniref:Uncharacterized protein n=1 Tax=Phytophthora oleae TaxID=2107226 RepID=A0ABD3FXN2_9STRA